MFVVFEILNSGWFSCGSVALLRVSFGKCITVILKLTVFFYFEEIKKMFVAFILVLVLFL